MVLSPYRVIRPILFRLPAEDAHNITLKLLPLLSKTPRVAPAAHPALKTTLWNRSFPNPVGLAAGFDKNAAVIGPMLGFGFGFVEAGTVTPKPQSGNPAPRVFRSARDEAVINRMGFPNIGLAGFKTNLEAFLDRRPRPPGLVGINIGMNKDQTDPAKDYVLLVQALGPFADYLSVNISSPNTPGLRDLQEKETFAALMARIIEARDRACGTAAPPPLLVKLSPDLPADSLAALARTARDVGVDGLILTNTTLDRPDHLPQDFIMEKGGLSGRPLRDKSTDAIRTAWRATDGALPIIGAGGISDADDAYEKIRAGASLVQLYSALAFHGPGVVKEITSGLIEHLRDDGFATIADAVGADHRA